MCMLCGEICMNKILFKPNLMELHKKIKHNEMVYCAQDLGSYALGQGCNQVRGQIVAKTTGANLAKLHRNIEHKKEVFLAEDLGFYAEGQGQYQVRGQIVPKNVAHKLLKQIQ